MGGQFTGLLDDVRFFGAALSSGEVVALFSQPVLYLNFNETSGPIATDSAGEPLRGGGNRENQCQKNGEPGSVRPMGTLSERLQAVESFRFSDPETGRSK